MENKWGGKGDEGQSCENMNEVHPANQDQLLWLECCTACTRQPIQINSITKGNAVTRPDTLPGGQIFTTGTINGACFSYVSPTAAEVPAACFDAALMPIVQALRSSPANTRCAGRLLPFLIIYAKHAGSTQFLSKKCGG